LNRSRDTSQGASLAGGRQDSRPLRTQFQAAKGICGRPCGLLSRSRWRLSHFLKHIPEEMTQQRLNLKSERSVMSMKKFIILYLFLDLGGQITIMGDFQSCGLHLPSFAFICLHLPSIVLFVTIRVRCLSLLFVALSPPPFRFIFYFD
jgi:hypothetical protein